jgi:hypothetical protein
MDDDWLETDWLDDWLDDAWSFVLLVVGARLWLVLTLILAVVALIGIVVSLRGGSLLNLLPAG